MNTYMKMISSINMDNLLTMFGKNREMFISHNVLKQKANLKAVSVKNKDKADEGEYLKDFKYIHTKKDGTVKEVVKNKLTAGNINEHAVKFLELLIVEMAKNIIKCKMDADGIADLLNQWKDKDHMGFRELLIQSNNSRYNRVISTKNMRISDSSVIATLLRDNGCFHTQIEQVAIIILHRISMNLCMDLYENKKSSTYGITPIKNILFNMTWDDELMGTMNILRKEAIKFMENKKKSKNDESNKSSNKKKSKNDESNKKSNKKKSKNDESNKKKSKNDDESNKKSKNDESNDESDDESNKKSRKERKNIKKRVTIDSDSDAVLESEASDEAEWSDED